MDSPFSYFNIACPFCSNVNSLFHLFLDVTEASINGESDNCNVVEPSKIILVNVKRSFHGNYSCQGMNRAGWGAMSKARELRVFYPPRGAQMRQEPAIIRKGNPFKVSGGYGINNKVYVRLCFFK